PAIRQVRANSQRLSSAPLNLRSRIVNVLHAARRGHHVSPGVCEPEAKRTSNSGRPADHNRRFAFKIKNAGHHFFLYWITRLKTREQCGACTSFPSRSLQSPLRLLPADQDSAGPSSPLP